MPVAWWRGQIAPPRGASASSVIWSALAMWLLAAGAGTGRTGRGRQGAAVKVVAVLAAVAAVAAATGRWR